MSLLQMSISAGLLIIAIVLIRSVGLNKLPKTAFLILWGIALFRLLVPVSIPLGFSIREAVPSTPAPALESVLVFEIPEPISFTSPAANGISPITIIWLLVMLGMFILFMLIYIKSHRDLRFATLINDNDFLNEWLKTHRLIRKIRIMQSDRINTPLAVGIINPKIILPKCMNMNDTKLLGHVLLHEYFHIKRFDALLKILMVFALCIHWFNPLVWIMFILANRDLEITCDEMSIRHLGTESKTAYAYSIIGMAKQKSRFALLYSGFSKNAAAERIEYIMKYKKSSFISMIMAFVLVAALSTLTIFAESPQAATRPSEAAIERLAAIIEEAGVAVLPYELRERLPVFDDYDEIRFVTDIDPEIYTWIIEKSQAGIPFLLFYPVYLLDCPDIYNLVMEGATWAEIMNIVTSRAAERLELAGIYRVIETNRPIRVFNVTPFDGEIKSITAFDGALVRLVDYLIDYLNNSGDIFPFIFPADFETHSPAIDLNRFREIRFIPAR